MKLLLILLLSIQPAFVLAQEKKTALGTINGSIVTSDRQPGAYVSVVIKRFVSVVLKNTKEGATSDDNGSFEIRKVKPGTYVLTISLLGYVDTSVAVEVINNETVSLRLRLRTTYAELRAVILEA